jgi:hypothetical protein
MDQTSLLQIIQDKLKQGMDIQKVSEFLLSKCIHIPISVLEFIKDKEEENNVPSNFTKSEKI